MEKLEMLFEVEDRCKMIFIIAVATVAVAKTAIEALVKAE